MHPFIHLWESLVSTSNGQRILLVEDEKIVAVQEAALLRRHNYTVVIAHTGEDALELVSRDCPFDIIVMDIDLGPGIDGTETARRILERWEIPIVFLTGHQEREMVERVKNITRYGYVLKGSGEFVLL